MQQPILPKEFQKTHCHNSNLANFIKILRSVLNTIMRQLCDLDSSFT